MWLGLGVRSMRPPSRAAANFLDSAQGADWTLFAGRPFHFTYQSWVLKSVLLADLPATLVASLTDLLLWPVSFVTHVGRYEGSYIAAGLLFVVATGQCADGGPCPRETIPHGNAANLSRVSSATTPRLCRLLCGVGGVLRVASGIRRLSGRAVRQGIRPRASGWKILCRSCGRWIGLRHSCLQAC